MGILECQLEQNVSAISPFYYTLNKSQRLVKDALFNGRPVDVTDMKMFNESLWKSRDTFGIDIYTFYPKESINKIKSGELYGDLDPLISNPNDLPKSTLYWAKDFKNFKFTPEIFVEQKKTYWFILFMIIFFIFGILKK